MGGEVIMTPIITATVVMASPSTAESGSACMAASTGGVATPDTALVMEGVAIAAPAGTALGMEGVATAAPEGTESKIKQTLAGARCISNFVGRWGTALRLQQRIAICGAIRSALRPPPPPT